MAAVSKDTAPPPSQQQQVGLAPPLTAAEEALKRNTDCVYFLASPLTCKKGSECEYRHSDYARMNPRDCWYWLNGNCLNAKCSFRHPPLEGLVPPQGGNIAGPAQRVPMRPPVPSTPQIAAKQGVPCIFFQQGYCLKGDMCPFMHGSVPPPTNKMQHVPRTTAAAEAPTVFKKTFGGPEKCTQTKMTFQATAPKVGEVPRQAPATAAPRAELAQPFDKFAAGKHYQPPNAVIEEAPKYKETIAPAEKGKLRSRTSAHRANSVEELNYQNGRDADESLRESSPGFDVLVDDKLLDDEYYPNEDQYRRMDGHERRNLNEFDREHHDDYNSVADVDGEIHHNLRGYDSYDRSREKYDRKPRGASSERTVGERAQYDRRSLYKLRSPDFAQNSDLRLRLSKQRHGSGLRSAVNPDYHSEDRGYKSSHRDSRRSPVREKSLGSRLQGRVKPPGRSPPLNGSSYSERETERGRSRRGLSPSRPPAFSQGRLRDRLSGRIQEESIEGRNVRGLIRNDSIQADANFAGPKSLAELRGTKQNDSRQQFSRGEQPLSGGKLRDTVLPSSLGTESNISFDGPKPLSEILKRKRDGGMAASRAGVNSDEKDFSKQKENINLISSNTNSVADKRKQVSAPAHTQAEVEENNQPLALDGVEEDGEISNKKIKLMEDETSIPIIENDLEVEEGVNVGDEEEHEVGEGGEPDVGDGDGHEVDEEYDRGDGEYEYEQDDGEGYNLNEGETAEHEDDYMDEDDGDDDFAKKLGVSF